jgi:hypothetical protein
VGTKRRKIVPTSSTGTYSEINDFPITGSSPSYPFGDDYDDVNAV